MNSYFSARAWAVLALCLVLGSAQRVQACASCGCGDPTLTAMGVEKPYKNRVRLSLEERLGGHRMGEEAAETLVSRTSLTASWSPTARLTLAALVPMVAVASWSAYRAVRRVVGLGDGELMLRGVVYRDRSFSPRHLLGLLAGVKLPTGPRMSDSSGYPAPADEQPGSGSFDALAGASYAYFGARLSAFASLSYRYTTPGFVGYRRGSPLGATAALQWQLRGAIALVAQTDFLYMEPDTLASGAAVPDSGGILWSLTPGLLLVPRQDWLIRLAVQIPTLQRWNGTQFEYPTAVASVVVDL